MRDPQESAPIPDKILIEALSAGRLDLLDEVYNQYRPAFLRWSKQRFKATPNDLEDAWQDAVIALYERVTSPQILVLRCSLRTYLFAIGSKRLMQNHRKTKRFFWKDDIDDALLQEQEVLRFDWDMPDLEIRQHLLEKVNQLDAQCRNLLLSRYYDGKELEDIQKQFNYQNINTVSASLSRCLKKLKNSIEKKDQHD